VVWRWVLGASTSTFSLREKKTGTRFSFSSAAVVWRWALGAGRFDFDFDIFLKGKKDGHPLFIQQCSCGVALGAGCWVLGAPL